MGKLEKLSITMPTEMVVAVQAMIDEGGYASVSEVMRAGLHSLFERQNHHGWSVDELRAAWNEGEASGDTLDGAQAMQALATRYAKPAA